MAVYASKIGTSWAGQPPGPGAGPARRRLRAVLMFAPLLTSVLGTPKAASGAPTDSVALENLDNYMDYRGIAEAEAAGRWPNFPPSLPSKQL